MRPQLWVIAGPNGAGKTTLVSARLAGRLTVVNPDTIAERLPRIDGRLDERQAGAIALGERNRLVAAGGDLAIETTLSGASAIRFMRRAKMMGYKLTLVFVGIDSAELSLARVADRVASGGHDVPPDAVFRRYPAILARLSEAIDLSDRVFLLDNSEERLRLIAVREGGRTRHLAQVLPEWAVQSLPGRLLE